jgi:hypothetical protein
MKSTLKAAEELVESVELNGAPLASLALFEFPYFDDAMSKRIYTCLDVYSEIFPARGQRPLNKDEVIMLRNRISKKL